MSGHESAESDVFDALAEEFVQRYRSGERPSLSDYANRHPELEEKIRGLFPTLVMMEEVKNGEGASTPRSARPPTPDGKLPDLGDYRIIREVGRGGMGVVYEAVQESLERHVALKVLPFGTSSNPVRLKRFEREARAAARLHHTSIVPVFGIGEHNGIHYYTMQFIEGRGLDEILRELQLEKTMQRSSGTKHISGTVCECEPSPGSAKCVTTPASTSPATTSSVLSTSTVGQGGSRHFSGIAKLVAQVADALAYAHAQGVMHRDIKPSNLLVDGHHRAWVTDFGLAKDEGEDLTHTGDIIGTLRYMAPEQFQGKTDARSDIYGLGMTLYEMLTLRPAFDASDRAQLVQQITQTEPPRPRKLDRRIPPDLETIVLKAIHQEPQRRYQTASELADDLRRFLDYMPIRARRSGTGERFLRWCRRNPLAAALTAFVACLLVTIAVGASVAAWKLNSSLTRVQSAEKESSYSLWKSYLAQARAGRRTQLPGQRFASLDALRTAATMLPSVGVDEEDVLALRNETIACLALVDIRVVRQESMERFAGVPAVQFDADFQRYTGSDRRGNLTVYRTADNRRLMDLPGSGNVPSRVRFSPNGRYLAAWRHGGRCRIWDLDHHQVTMEQLLSRNAFDFAPDNRTVVFGPREGRVGSIQLYDLATGEQTDAFLSVPEPMEVRFDPAGRRIAVCGKEHPGVQVIDLERRDKTWNAPDDYVRAGVHTVAWSPDGQLLAWARDNQAVVWDVVANRLRTVLHGHQQEIVGLVFNHGSDMLASWSWDGTSRLWDPRNGKELLRTMTLGELYQFSRTDRRIAFRNRFQAGVLGAAMGRECRTLHAHDGHGPWCVDVSPCGRLMASAGTDGLRLWDLNSLREIAFLDIGPSRSALFDRVGNGLFTCSEHGLLYWPISDAADGKTFELQTPKTLGVSEAPPDVFRAAQSADGRFLAFVGDPREIRVRDLTGQTETVLQKSHTTVKGVAISPDGKWVVANHSFGRGFRLWEAQSGKPLRELEHRGGDPDVGYEDASFSPDGRWLVTAASRDYRFWKTGSWELKFRIPMQNKTTRHVAFTRDGRIVAVPVTRYLVKLFDTASGREIASLEPPNSQLITWLCFTPDGSRLAVACLTNTIQLWDLRRIREQLTESGLDWDMEPYPPLPPDIEREPLRVQLPPEPIVKPSSLSRQRQLQEAVARYSQIIAADPNDAHSFHLRAHSYERLNQLQLALEDYAKAIALQPDSPHLHLCRGRVCRRAGQTDQALNHHRRAIELQPEEPATLNSLAWFSVTGPPEFRNPSEGLKLAKRAVELDPRKYAYWNTLGVVHFRLGDYAKAQNALQQATDANPRGPTGYDLFPLAMSCYQLGDIAGAQEYYVDAFEWCRENRAVLDQELQEFRAEAEVMLGDQLTAFPITLEGESLGSTAQATQGDARQQTMTPFGHSWNGDAQLFWNASQPGARLTLQVDIPVTGSYSVAAYFTKSYDFGQVQVYVNGQTLGAVFDGYHRRVVHHGELALGTVSLEPGRNQFAFEIIGKHERSTGYNMGIDTMQLTPH